MKGFGRRNANVKYESPSTYQSKVMAKVKLKFSKRRSNFNAKVKG
jgi:hypothetical protein